MQTWTGNGSQVLLMNLKIYEGMTSTFKGGDTFSPSEMESSVDELEKIWGDDLIMLIVKWGFIPHKQSVEGDWPSKPSFDFNHFQIILISISNSTVIVTFKSTGKRVEN